MAEQPVFTEKTVAVLDRAREIASRFGHAEVTTPVLVVALWEQARDMAVFLFERLGLDKNQFLGTVSSMLQAIPKGSGGSPAPSASFDACRTAASALARETNVAVASSEHLFWSLAVIENPVRVLFTQAGITREKLREAVLAFRGAHPETEGDAAAARYPALHKYGRDLLALAREGAISPAIGREHEIRRVLQILSRKTKNNPVLVGEPGTGKTAIVEGLVHRILKGDVPVDMKGIRPFSLDLTALVAGASHMGEFEERLKKVLDEASSDPSIVLFIDEIHQLIGAGRSSGAMDAANILKPELARGRLMVIGATTHDEYRAYIEKDAAFERRFQKVEVDEPDIDSAIAILRGIKAQYERHHRTKILDSAVVAAVRLSKRYISDRFLPDKAIDLLDEAASRMRIERASVPRELDELSRAIRRKEIERESILQDGTATTDVTPLDLEIANLRERENERNAKWQNERALFERLQSLQDEAERLHANARDAEQASRFDEAAALDRRASDVERQAAEVVAEMEEQGTMLKRALDENDIMQVVTDWTGIPVSKMNSDEAQRFAHAEDELRRSVIGQDRAVAAVAAVLRRNRLGLGDPSRPIGSFLFLGSTGVGKTELAKALAEFLFDSRDMLVRIDMSEYQQEHAVARLFGAPPGYVGYDQGGQLTEAVRRKPYSVVLFDEIEKAHPKVFETLLQILDDGCMTDGQGRTVNFKNTILILTSNIGQRKIHEYFMRGLESGEAVVTAAVLAELRNRVSPEFLNRLDEAILFRPLTKEDIQRIVQIQLASLAAKMKTDGVRLSVDSGTEGFLAEKGYDPEYGARPVKRAINKFLLDALSVKLLSGEIRRDRPIAVTAGTDSLRFANG